MAKFNDLVTIFSNFNGMTNKIQLSVKRVDSGKNMFRTYKNFVRRYLRDESGNFALIFGVSSMALLMATGVAIDHSNLVSTKAKSQYALDASVMAAARSYQVDQSSKNAKKLAKKVFKEHCESFKCDKKAKPKITVKSLSADNASFSVSGQYSGASSSLFLSKLSAEALDFKTYSEVGVTASGKNHEVYIAMDMSASVGIASTQTEIDLLKTLTKPFVNGMPGAEDGCAFACHQAEFFISPVINGSSVTTYDFAKANNIRLREDDILDAASSLVSDIFDTGNPNIKVGAYAFSDSVEEIKAPTNSDFSIRSIVNGMNLSYWATRFDVVFSTLTQNIGESGSGATSSDPVKSIIIVTDGLNNNYDAGIITSAFNANYCSDLKNNGVKVAVLHVPYPDLSGQPWYEAFAKPYLSSIPSQLEACASSENLYFIGTDATGISEALNLMATALLDGGSSELAFKQ